MVTVTFADATDPNAGNYAFPPNLWTDTGITDVRINKTFSNIFVKLSELLLTNAADNCADLNLHGIGDGSAFPTEYFTNHGDPAAGTKKYHQCKLLSSPCLYSDPPSFLSLTHNQPAIWRAEWLLPHLPDANQPDETGRA